MIRLTVDNIKDVKVAYTHGGVFHADDVFSTALLELMNPEIEVIRTFKVPDDAELAFDIGGGIYDHHQEDSEVRECDIPYAAFGLLWRDLGADFLGSQEEADKADVTFVQHIDLTDNTGTPNTLSSAISSFNPNWYEEPSAAESRFRDAVEFAVQILANLRQKVQGKLKAREIVQIALESSDGKVVCLPRFAPWHDALVPSDAKFVVYPSQRSGYNLQTIPVEFGSQEAKIPLPSSWLEPANVPDGCSFVHKGLFIAAFDTETNAILAAKRLVIEDLLKTSCNVPENEVSYIHGEFSKNRVDIVPFIENRFTADELNELVLIMKHVSNISDYVEVGYNHLELNQVRLGLDNGVNIRPYTDEPNLNWTEMEQIRLGLEKSLDVSVYAKYGFDSGQMEQIRLGLEKSLDVSVYAKYEFNYKQMYQIRLGLEKSLDVSVYTNPNINASAMEKTRLGLEAGFDMTGYIHVELSILGKD